MDAQNKITADRMKISEIRSGKKIDTQTKRKHIIRFLMLNNYSIIAIQPVSDHDEDEDEDEDEVDEEEEEDEEEESRCKECTVASMICQV